MRQHNSWVIALLLLGSLAARGADADGFDYPFGPPNGQPRAPGTAQAAGAWQNVQDFGVNGHLGEDWNFGFGSDDLGKPIYAAANGDVVYAQDVGGDGSWKGVIIIQHSGTGLRLPGGGTVQKVKTFYGHLDPASINQWVTVGSRVARGQQIGVIGPTPTTSTGPHLHFEIRTNLNIGVVQGNSSDPTGWIDPSDFIDANRPSVAVTSNFVASIAQAVSVNWTPRTNKSYKVYGSQDLVVWEFLSGPFESSAAAPQYFHPVPWAANKFFRVEESSAALLDWLDGTWSGTTYQTQLSSGTFRTTINANRTTGIYSATYDFPCSGNLTLISATDREARFNLTITSGNCVDGSIVLSRLTATNITYTWIHKDGASVATSFAVLNKQ